MRNGWVKEEAGWYTHDANLGVTLEADGRWHVYVPWPKEAISRHRTCKAAMLAAEKWLESAKEVEGAGRHVRRNMTELPR